MQRLRRGKGGLRAIRYAIALVAIALICPVVAFAIDNPSDSDGGLTVTSEAGDFKSTTNNTATTYDGEPMTASDATNGHCMADGEQGTVGSLMTKTLWWRFTGTGGPVTISSYYSNFDTVLAVWTIQNIGGTDFFVFNRCNDDVDVDHGDLTSELVMATETGRTYYVQVGGCDGCTFNGDPTPDSGSLGFYVYPPPPNDRRTGAETVPLNANISGDSLGAVTDNETTRCSGATFGKTLWYRFVVPRAGTATIDASGYPSAISLYAGSSTAQLACAPGSSGNATSLARHLGPGTYYAQVGGRGSGLGAARGDLNFKVNFVADPDGGGGGGSGPVQPPVDPDTDGDGLVDSQDCAPTDPKRRAGFKEVRGNKIDEDCDRIAQDFREVRARRGPVTYLATSSTLLRSFLVNRISKGDKVTITCKGKGCRTKRVVKTFRKARARYDFRHQLRRNRPRPGAVVEVRVTHAKRIGHVWRFTFRSYKAPKLKEDLCLRPGASKAKPCP